ncbi:MAG: heavy-metal-associated domain-containing protein [Aquificaceae bacterium]
MGEKRLRVGGMTCEHCANTVRRALMSIDGVSEVKVDLRSGEVRILMQKHISEEALKEAIEELGYKVIGEV